MGLQFGIEGGGGGKQTRSVGRVLPLGIPEDGGMRRPKVGANMRFIVWMAAVDS